jgi:exodeoxyribonuclease V beta subunit
MRSTRGYGPELTHMLTAGLRKVLDAPLDAEGLTLSQVSKARRRDEMEFVFPVRAPLTPRTLERVFKDHRAPPSAPQYAATLRELSFETLKGFLRGFIDLVFSHEGRFFIVDYKSNHLGSQPEDYAQDALARAMVEHHYYLQYHLYSVALHRHLRLRVAGYDYETHFGGVYYLFLRGMAPEHPAGCGVFFDRPSLALIEALDALLESGEGGRRP